jgi:hypothetical protein
MNADIKTYGAAIAPEFSAFIAACTKKATEIGCNFLEVRVYGDYNYTQAAFLFDKFGGIAAIINNFKGGRFTGSYSGESEDKVENFETIDAALAPVAEAYKYEEAVRSRIEFPTED